MNKRIGLFILFVNLIFIAGCGKTIESESNEGDEKSVKATAEESVKETEEEKSNDLGAFKKIKVVPEYTVQEFNHGDEEPISVDFEQTDILRFEQLESSIYGELMGMDFCANNVGDETVTSLKLYFSLCDSDNIEKACSNADGLYAIEPNKAIEFSQLLVSHDGYDYYDHTAFTAYDYSTQQMNYHVDLQAQTAVTWEKEHNGLDFEKYDIFNFDMESKGIDSIGAINLDTTVNNHSDFMIEVVEFQYVALDKNDNFIAQGGSTARDVPANGTVVTQCFIFNPKRKDYSKIESLGIVSYKYRLTEPDENGYTGYKVDLINMEIQGMTKYN